MVGIDLTVLGLLLFASLLGVCGLFWAAALMVWQVARRLGWAR